MPSVPNLTELGMPTVGDLSKASSRLDIVAAPSPNRLRIPLYQPRVQTKLRIMAPKAVADKKPAQPAKKAVAKKSAGGKKKGSKKAVESYKIYIYKVQS